MTRKRILLIAVLALLLISTLFGYTHPVSFNQLQTRVDINFPSSGAAIYKERATDAEGKVHTSGVPVELNEEQVAELLDILRQYQWSRTLDSLIKRTQYHYENVTLTIALSFSGSQTLNLFVEEKDVYFQLGDGEKIVQFRCTVDDHEGMCETLLAYLQSITPAE